MTKKSSWIEVWEVLLQLYKIYFQTVKRQKKRQRLVIVNGGPCSTFFYTSVERDTGVPGT